MVQAAIFICSFIFRPLVCNLLLVSNCSHVGMSPLVIRAETTTARSSVMSDLSQQQDNQLTEGVIQILQ